MGERTKEFKLWELDNSVELVHYTTEDTISEFAFHGGWFAAKEDSRIHDYPYHKTDDWHSHTKQIADLTAQVAKLKGDIQCMVKKAADRELPAYREQGMKLMAMEDEITTLSSERLMLMQSIAFAIDELKHTRILPDSREQTAVDSLIYVLECLEENDEEN